MLPTVGPPGWRIRRIETPNDGHECPRYEVARPTPKFRVFCVICVLCGFQAARVQELKKNGPASQPARLLALPVCGQGESSCSGSDPGCTVSPRRTDVTAPDAPGVRQARGVGFSPAPIKPTNPVKGAAWGTREGDYAGNQSCVPNAEGPAQFQGPQ